MGALLFVLALFVAMPVAGFLVGSAVPRRHRLERSRVIELPIERVYRRLRQVEKLAAWRSGLASVEVVGESPLRWRETGTRETHEYVEESAEPPRRWVVRLTDGGRSFARQWAFALEPVPEGTWVTLVEEGELGQPIARFIARFLFGYHHAVERCLADLERSFRHAELDEGAGSVDDDEE